MKARRNKASNLGPIQKSKIGSMVAYHSSEAIKRLADLRDLKKYRYLNYYISDSFIVDILAAGELYSDEIFNTFIELINYLIDKEKLGLYDVKK